MRRLLVLCTRPFHHGSEDARSWLEREAGALLADDSVVEIRLTSLDSMSQTWGRQWDFLIEIRLRGASGATPALADLLGDLRLLGMHPTVVAADDERAVAIGR